MAFELAVVSAHISGLTVSGKLPTGSNQNVTIWDYDDITDAADIRACPIFCPDVNRQVQAQLIDRVSYGTGSTAKQVYRYVIPYALLYMPVGSGRVLAAGIMPYMIATVKAIVGGLIANDAPSDAVVDIRVNSVLLGQTVNDPAGNQFHGALIDILAHEFIN